MEIIQRSGRDDHPFIHDRHQILKAGEATISARRGVGSISTPMPTNPLACSNTSCTHCRQEISQIVESAPQRLFAAHGMRQCLRGATVEDDRLGSVVADGRYLDATGAVLRERGGLWFFDESYVISRRRA